MALIRANTSSGGGGGNRTYDSVGRPTSARIECGFPPRIIMVYDNAYSSRVKLAVRYNSDVNPSKYDYQYDGSSYNENLSAGGHLYNVDLTGFNLPQYSYLSTSVQIVAIE